MPRISSLATRVVAALVVGTLGLLAVLAVVGLGPRHVATRPARGRSRPVVTASVTRCGDGFDAVATQPVGQIDVRDDDSRPGEVRVVAVGGARDGAVYADLELLAPGTTVPLAIDLPTGSYAVQCLMEDEEPVTGGVVDVQGASTGTRGVPPVDQSELLRTTLDYQAAVGHRLGRVRHRISGLVQHLASGDLPAARHDWIAAHRGYQLLGGAYGAFGELGDAIDGLPHGPPTLDRHPVTGFHRIEHDLFTARPHTARLIGDARALASDLAALSHRLRSTQLAPLDLVLRAHEITEDLLQRTLTGRDDLGSHTALATADGDLAATADVLRRLRPVLTGRVPHPARLFTDLTTTRALVRRLARTPDAHRSVAQWPRVDREQLASAVAGLAESLAPLAVALEPRRTS
ncbi:EfeM/EfeO family lipoprotein [Nocardioides acrostichi]|uniref:EfeM/EfeO family lipoprotein n=1 Tax=Nocardioides acrostichi TaxID=2784339 RepID=A0A930UZ98_9ACTN|nr:EfeM/EfeO family lipoprotein [Nocardioides acrostichi]MBF4160996.1 EfeM/EfeO family lipoprotein [Nocardioides acrostichi]